MREILYIIFLACILSASALADTRIPIKITKIYDGDTVKAQIDNNKPFKIRLTGIDCYETTKIHRAYKQAYCNHKSIDDVIASGRDSKKYLKKLYNNNKSAETYLEFKGIDMYGRALGVLYFDTLNVNENLKNFGGCLNYNYK